MKTITVNGMKRELPTDMTVAELVSELKLDRFGIAIVVNGEVIPRTTYAEWPLNNDDQLDIVRAVAGG